MHRSYVQHAVALLGVAAGLCAAPRAMAIGGQPAPAGDPQYTPDELKGITIDEKLNQPLPLDLSFTDDRGQTVSLKQYFSGKKPVILQLGYYGCPMLCDLVSQGLVKSLKDLTLDAGKDFEVVFISIDPKESWKLAQQKKQSYAKEYARGNAAEGWHFLVGKADDIATVANAAGFRYKWVASAQQFSHPAAIILCTPEGKVSRYLYGVAFNPQTLRLSLVEASEGKIGSTMDRFILTCFHYDGSQGKYAASAKFMMRSGGVLTVVVLGAVLWRLWRRDRLEHANQSSAPLGM